MSRLPYIIFGVIGFLVLALVVGVIGIGRSTSRPQPATLEFWGTEEDDTAWSDALALFRKTYPHITINYRHFDEAVYEDTLINRLAEGKGPDVFMLKNSWIVRHRDKIAVLPQDIFKVSIRDLEQTFADGPREELIDSEQRIFGFPLFVETPALFYNKDIFNAAGIAELPHTWDDVERIAQKLTVKTSVGDIVKSGLALGTWRTIDHAFEIVSSMMLHYGDLIVTKDLKNPDLGPRAIEAVKRYVSFADPRQSSYSWNDRMSASLDAFAQEKTAMAIGFPADIARLKTRNPNIDFGIIPFPQSKNARAPAVYARYFFPAISKLSKNQIPAWQFALFLSSREGARAYFTRTPRPPARRDLIAAGPPTPELDAFWRQALIAKGWPVPHERAAQNLFEQTITSIVSKESRPEEALQRMREQMRLLLP